MSDGNPAHLFIVPGFMSPNWMMYPLYRHLRKHFEHIELWDHPHVFSDPEAVAEEFGSRIAEQANLDRKITMVTHSFGDWIARRAIGSTGVSVEKLAAICPLVTEAPAVRLVPKLVQDWIPELQIMADPTKASSHQLPETIERLVIWARWDAWVRRSASADHQREIIADGTHNSIVLQPGVWSHITQFLTV